MSKYPRTFHLPWSPGGTSDDKRLTEVTSLLGVDLVITEKMDGSNVCMEREACFARSHGGSPTHPSFDAFKAMHAGIRYAIPVRIQIFGEWLWAKHSIAYTNLDGYFQVFGVRACWQDGSRFWKSLDDLLSFTAGLGLPTVPVLWGGKVSTEVELRHLT